MIFEFYGKECPHCQSMKPIVEKLKNEGIVVESLEVWHNDDNANKMREYDNQHCGGVPFYVNPDTKKWICGATTYEELKKINQ